MAGLNLSLNFDSITLASATTWKSIASIAAPADQMVKLKRVKVTGNGIAGDAEPINARLTRVTAASGTGTATTPQKLNNGLGATPRSTCRTNFTAEPTEVGTAPYIYSAKFHPQGGSIDEISFDDVFIEEETELVLEMMVPSGGTAINVSGHLIFEE